MTLLQAIILGLVQGLTEFLPVSSSGHLALTSHYLEVENPGLTFEIVLHFGTLLSVLIYFWRPLWGMFRSLFNKEMKDERRMIGYLFIATLPAAVIGLTFKHQFEALSDKPVIVSLLLCVTGATLLLPRLFPKKHGNDSMTLRTALIMGFGQAFAILPGISRSGSTIVSGLLSKVSPAKAAEFSFLLAVPAIGGAAVLALKDLEHIDASLAVPYAAGGLVSFVSGLIAVYAVLSSIRKGKFEYFAYYCIAVGLISFIYLQFMQG
ncbi:MAG: undecaprenyl-diphosphate phosphatase [Verrucomicrobiales bacterium]|nr:undecaprenyl-diphosphate phosphatase [Verrucomicrobiales bacterium]